MRRSFLFCPLASLLLIAGCGQDEPRGEDLQTHDVQMEPAPPPMAAPRSAESAADAGGMPNVSPTAAPGVAFNYRYAFRLPAQRISELQEQHARACEQLGISRCRITGMRFRVVNERDIQAMLAFKLEPSIARRFGQAGVEAVRRADGMLVDAEISGADVGTSIRAAGRNIEEMAEELNRLEARLRGGRLSSDERSRLEYEAQQLRQSIRATRANREEQQESLATTPVVFNYGSGDLVPGFDARSTFRKALEQAGDNFIEGIAILFIIVVTLLPWAALALLLWWSVRLVRRRMPGADRRAAAGPAATDEVAPEVS